MVSFTVWKREDEWIVVVHNFNDDDDEDYECY